MAIERLDKQFRELTGKRLNNTSSLNLYNILRDKDEDIDFMNIFRSYVVSDSNFDDRRLYNQHQVTETDWLDNISYRYYDTPALWWLIALTNNIVNPFEDPKAGDSLKILKFEYIYRILREVDAVGDL